MFFLILKHVLVGFPGFFLGLSPAPAHECFSLLFFPASVVVCKEECVSYVTVGMFINYQSALKGVYNIYQSE